MVACFELGAIRGRRAMVHATKIIDGLLEFARAGARDRVDADQLILIGYAVTMARATQSLLIGESADREMVDGIRRIAVAGLVGPLKTHAKPA